MASSLNEVLRESSIPEAYNNLVENSTLSSLSVFFYVKFSLPPLGPKIMTDAEKQDMKDLLRRLRLATGTINSLTSLPKLPSFDSQQTQMIDLMDIDDLPQRITPPPKRRTDIIDLVDEKSAQMPPKIEDGGFISDEMDFDLSKSKPLSVSNRRSFLPGVQMHRVPPKAVPPKTAVRFPF
jgi:hypothetical protein